jgi:hypothetical protein
MKNIFLTLFISLSIYFILTLPHLISIYTMDTKTGDYYGYVYPLWLIFTISLISGILGNIITKKLEK